MLPRLSAPVSTAPVRGSTPTLCCSPLCCPAPTGLVRVPRQLPSPGSRHQLSFASPSHFRIRRDFRSKNPLSGFAPKQTKESPALAAHPHSATHAEKKLIIMTNEHTLFERVAKGLCVRGELKTEQSATY